MMYHNKIFLIPLFFALLTFFLGYAQTRDTLIIKLNDAYPEMRKSKGFAYKPISSIKDSIFSYYYDIEVETEDDYTDVMLLHSMESPKTIEYFDSDYVNPITKIVNKDYLKGKRVLDISFFKTHTFEEIRALFKGENRPFLFLYEVGEGKKNKIILREVRFMDYLRI